MSGWIKLHRKIRDKGYYKNSKFVHLWVHILLKANHEGKEFMRNNQIIVIKEGQLITGRKQLSEETGISESSIERILEMFENEHQIEQQKTTKFRLITILNWKEYQTNGQQNGQQADNGRTTSGHKQELKEQRELKELGDKPTPTTIEERKRQFTDKVYEFNIYPKEMLDAFLNHWLETNGKKLRFETEKIFELPRRLATWKRNENKFAKAGKSQPALGEYVTYEEILKFTQNESAEFRKSIFDKYEAIGNGKFKLKK